MTVGSAVPPAGAIGEVQSERQLLVSVLAGLRRVRDEVNRLEDLLLDHVTAQVLAAHIETAVPSSCRMDEAAVEAPPAPEGNAPPGEPASKRKPAWKAEEDAVLRQRFPVGGAKACAEALPERTIAAIQVRASCLKVKRDPVAAARLRAEVQNGWTDEELERLTANWAMGGLRVCEAMFPGRSAGSIKFKAAQLGLKIAVRRPRQNAYRADEDDVLREFWVSDGFAKCGPLLPGRSHKSIRSRVRTLGLKRAPGRQKASVITSVAEPAAVSSQPKRKLTFEEQLALVETGKATVSAVVRIPTRQYDYTLGGVSA